MYFTAKNQRSQDTSYGSHKSRSNDNSSKTSNSHELYYKEQTDKSPSSETSADETKSVTIQLFSEEHCNDISARTILW